VNVIHGLSRHLRIRGPQLKELGTAFCACLIQVGSIECLSPSSSGASRIRSQSSRDGLRGPTLAQTVGSTVNITHSRLTADGTENFFRMS